MREGKCTFQEDKLANHTNLAQHNRFVVAPHCAANVSEAVEANDFDHSVPELDCRSVSRK